MKLGRGYSTIDGAKWCLADSYGIDHHLETLFVEFLMEKGWLVQERYASANWQTTEEFDEMETHEVCSAWSQYIEANKVKTNGIDFLASQWKEDVDSLARRVKLSEDESDWLSRELLELLQKIITEFVNREKE
jgi:hypothetical protein